MKMKRRTFIKTSLAVGAAAAVPGLLNGLAANAEVEPRTLPWQREAPLREAAKSATLEGALNPAGPEAGGFGGEGAAATTINNLKMRTAIWGPPERITISINKNNVWDRRLHDYPAPTLEEITEGAFAPVNENYVGRQQRCLRPLDYGWLWKEGGSHDPYREPMRYAFPCLKPVGQMILGIDSLAGAAAPRVVQSCANGVVNVRAAKGEANVNLDYVLGMTSNVYAIRGNFSGIDSPVWLRLYRHRDTSHLTYMKADGQTYTNPAAEADKAFNGPIDPPTSGADGRCFWIRQRMPAEKTFPQGFEYVLMGVVIAPNNARLESVEGKTGLGTPPPDPPMPWDMPGLKRPSIAEAPGAAATAALALGEGGKMEALVTIVTTMDGPDLLSLAKQRLSQAEAGGFDGVVEENSRWWADFYDRRESGRIFHGAAGADCSDDIREIYRSYTDSHGGGTKTDMRQFECSASYTGPDRDIQDYDSAPCYNEIFTTSRFVRNWGDSEDMWKQIVWHWMPGAQENARDLFNLPGMLISHGYLPPVKPDKYVHTTITLEFCLGTMAQIVRPAWDEWDYGGDMKALREECYPLLKQMALFYAAYARKGDDGYYHVIPCMQEEDWGFYPKFARNKDVISSLCMFRWALTRAADAAELLEADAGLRENWREVAAHIAPYPTWDRPEGKVFAEMPGLEPMRLPTDHFGDAASYPTLLADEINLDSPHELREMMVRSVQTLPSGSTNPTLILLGVPPPSPDPPAGNEYGPAARAAAPGMRRVGADAEMLLNSRGGRIHLFPVPAWDPPAVDAVSKKNEIAFRNFQARGGFLVSACKNSDGVYYLEIEARRDHPCRLMNPWPGEKAVVREVGETQPVPVQLDASNGECLVFSALAEHKYLVARSS
ncbi:MAG: twin-arginine translocation signal domain-containing protein [Terracidiphilus sp.]